MNWDAIGAIGEIVGAVAVVGSLIYLATQISVSNRVARNSANEELFNQWASNAELLAGDSERAQIFIKGLTRYDSLNQEEKFRFNLQMHQTINAWERNLIQSKAEEIDRHWIKKQDWVRRRVVNSPGFSQYYHYAKGSISPELCEVIESEIGKFEEWVPGRDYKSDNS